MIRLDKGSVPDGPKGRNRCGCPKCVAVRTAAAVVPNGGVAAAELYVVRLVYANGTHEELDGVYQDAASAIDAAEAAAGDEAVLTESRDWMAAVCDSPRPVGVVVFASNTRRTVYGCPVVPAGAMA